MGRIDKYKGLREDIKKGSVEIGEDNFPKFRKKRQRQETIREESAQAVRKNIQPAFIQQKESQRAVDKRVKAIKTSGKKGRKKKRRGCLRVFLIFLLLLILGIVFAILSFKKSLDKADDNRPPVEHFEGKKAANGASNILILGTDERSGQTSGAARSDSIMILQVDGPNNRPKLVSIMRDTLVTIPQVGADQKINNAYTIGEQNPYTGKGVGSGMGQGAELMRETLKENFDLDVRYYAMVDFSQFANIIDSLFPKGLEIDAAFATVNGKKVKEVKVPDDLNKKPGKKTPWQTIQVGKQKMDGRTALNYARFRHDDENDFGRVKRQQQVLAAILSQVKDPAVLFNGPNALGKVVGYTSTDVPSGFMLKSIWGVLTGKDKSIAKFAIPMKDGYQGAIDFYGGEALQITDMEATKKKLHQFLDE